MDQVYGTRWYDFPPVELDSILNRRCLECWLCWLPRSRLGTITPLGTSCPDVHCYSRQGVKLKVLLGGSSPPAAFIVLALWELESREDSSCFAPVWLLLSCVLVWFCCFDRTLIKTIWGEERVSFSLQLPGHCPLLRKQSGKLKAGSEAEIIEEHYVYWLTLHRVGSAPTELSLTKKIAPTDLPTVQSVGGIFSIEALSSQLTSNKYILQLAHVLLSNNRVLL